MIWHIGTRSSSIVALNQDGARDGCHHADTILGLTRSDTETNQGDRIMKKLVVRFRFALAFALVCAGAIPAEADIVDGFLYSGGVFTVIDAHGGNYTDPCGINDHGQVVGFYGEAGISAHGFLYDGGTFTSIDVPGAVNTSAARINNRGDIIGSFFDGKAHHGYEYRSGVFTTIDVPGADITEPFGINDSGQIVGAFLDATGIHGFLYSEGFFTTLDVPWGGDAMARGINDSGQIVGIAYSPFTGFLDVEGAFAVVLVPGSSFTAADDINNRAEVVGDFGDSTGTHGFLYSGGRFSVIDLPGARATEVTGINNRGDMVGIGEAGEVNATPVPELGSLLLLGTILILLISSLESCARPIRSAKSPRAGDGRQRGDPCGPIGYQGASLVLVALFAFVRRAVGHAPRLVGPAACLRPAAAMRSRLWPV